MPPRDAPAHGEGRAEQPSEHGAAAGAESRRGAEAGRRAAWSKAGGGGGGRGASASHAM